MNKKDYKHYQIEDFLTDDEFKRWVLERDKSLNQFWEKWIEAHPEKKASVYKAREILQRLSFTHHTIDDCEQEKVLEQVLQGQKSSRFEASVNAAPNKPVALITSKWWLKVAASLLLLGCIFILERLATQDPKPAEQVAKVKNITRSLPKGQKLTMMLPDGSRVHLNAESSITYPEKFGDNTRTVTLTGEAYFDVVKNKEKPFIVHTGQVEAIVLGTSFNVNAFPEQDEIAVSLVTGKVKVLPKSDGQHSVKEVVLIKGEKVTIDKATSQMVKSSFDIETEVGWKDGVLVFAEDDYKMVMDKLERWYGVAFEAYNQPGEKWKIKGRFDNLSLEEVLENLKYTHKINYKIEKKTVYLNF